MTSKQMIDCIGMMMVAMPHIEPIQPDKLAEMAKVWAMMWTDTTVDEFASAMLEAIKRHGYNTFVSPGEIEAVLQERRVANELTAMQAWGMVINAVHKYGSYQEQAALASMPEEVAETVRAMTWGAICDSPASSEGVLRGQFIKAYESVVDKKHVADRGQQQLSQSTLKALEGGKK